MLCTIVAGAKRHRLKPWADLHDVILQLMDDPSPEQLTRLLPDCWALAHPEHVLTHRLEESRQKVRRRNRAAKTSEDTVRCKTWRTASH